MERHQKYRVLRRSALEATDVLPQIFQYLSTLEVFAVSRTSKSFHMASKKGCAYNRRGFGLIYGTDFAYCKDQDDTDWEYYFVAKKHVQGAQKAMYEEIRRSAKGKYRRSAKKKECVRKEIESKCRKIVVLPESRWPQVLLNVESLHHGPNTDLNSLEFILTHTMGKLEDWLPSLQALQAKLRPSNITITRGPLPNEFAAFQMIGSKAEYIIIDSSVGQPDLSSIIFPNVKRVDACIPVSVEKSKFPIMPDLQILSILQCKSRDIDKFPPAVLLHIPNFLSRPNLSKMNRVKVIAVAVEKLTGIDQAIGCMETLIEACPNLRKFVTYQNSFMMDYLQGRVRPELPSTVKLVEVPRNKYNVFNLEEHLDDIDE